MRGKPEVKERWMNLAPVKDFCVVDEEGGGVVRLLFRTHHAAYLSQSHLIVASGASNANSLRIVRSGVGLEEVIQVEGIEDVTNMWDLSSDR